MAGKFLTLLEERHSRSDEGVSSLKFVALIFVQCLVFMADFADCVSKK